LTYTTTPRIGQFGLTRISGLTGKFVEAGQALVGSRSMWTHAFVVVSDDEIVQAQPGGAVRVPLRDALNGRGVVFSDFGLDIFTRGRIAREAEKLVGTPYSFADYAAIGAARLLHTTRIEAYVEDSGHMICSQLVDEAFARAGIELFPNRLAGDVTPGDLARLIGA
jgi:cell wall-associated NlpC family hydrolase